MIDSGEIDKSYVLVLPLYVVEIAILLSLDWTASSLAPLNCSNTIISDVELEGVAGVCEHAQPPWYVLPFVINV